MHFTPKNSKVIHTPQFCCHSSKIAAYQRVIDFSPSSLSHFSPIAKADRKYFAFTSSWFINNLTGPLWQHLATHLLWDINIVSCWRQKTPDQTRACNTHTKIQPWLLRSADILNVDFPAWIAVAGMGGKELCVQAEPREASLSWGDEVIIILQNKYTFIKINQYKYTINKEWINIKNN